MANPLDIEAAARDNRVMHIKEKLAALGYDLPQASRPVAAYLPAVESGGHLFLSGQLPMKDGSLTATGPVGASGGTTLEQAQEAARQCALNGIAQIDLALDGDWTRFKRIVKLGVFVASGAEFSEHHLVANGASELVAKVFGEQGQHARAAVGVPSLPLNASVEIDFVVSVH